MNHESVIRTALIAGLVLLAVVGLLLIGAPAVDMIRAHLGL